MKILKINLLTLLLYSGLGFSVFKDETSQSGIEFTHFNGMTGKFYFHEMMGGGVALFDYDKDGDLDVFLNQGHMIGPLDIKHSIFKPKHDLPLMDKLYRNDSVGNKIKFVDVSNEAGLRAEGYGMGVTYGDIDNDGDLDLYILNFGMNQMWLNNGDGTFEDVTVSSDTGGSSWSSSASFVDYDKDGFLDLYVVNYVEYSIENFIKCKSYDGSLDYCSPQGYKPSQDRLYHNNGNGKFTDVSSRSGVSSEAMPGLGVVSADFNNDGWIDLYVANDGRENVLWVNNKKGGFTNKAMTSGVAVNMTGLAEASMGVDAADFDNDGDVDLFMTHLNKQTNTLYVNNGKGWFADSGVRLGLGSTSFLSTGFGTAWLDFNNDGKLDLVSANGGVIKEPKQMKSGSKYPLMQKNQLWLNLGDKKYKEVSQDQDVSFLKPGVSRGLAYGDIDNDGDTDVIISNNSGEPQLLINHNKTKNNWIGLKLLRKDINREDVSAKIEVEFDKKKIYRRVKIDGSYASAHDSRIIVGLGKNKKTKISVNVIWSDGVTQIFEGLAINQYNNLVREKND